MIQKRVTKPQELWSVQQWYYWLWFCKPLQVSDSDSAVIQPDSWFDLMTSYASAVSVLLSSKHRNQKHSQEHLKSVVKSQAWPHLIKAFYLVFFVCRRNQVVSTRSPSVAISLYTSLYQFATAIMFVKY